MAINGANSGTSRRTMTPDSANPSSNPSTPPDWSNLEADLARSFQPSWTKESGGSVGKIPAHWEREDSNDSGRPPRGPRHDKFRDRRDSRGPRDKSGDKRSGRPGGPHGKSKSDPRGPRRDSGPRGSSRHPSDSHRLPPQPAALSGWKIDFLPDAHGLQGLARQIKHNARAYSLFDLARLVLDHPTRYFVRLQRTDGPTLARCSADQSLWTTTEDALRHALDAHLENFYRRETRTLEAIKGNFTCVARCGLSGTLLGPPNHHEYQLNLRRLHSGKFSRMPFEAFQARIQIVRDEAVIEEWKLSQTTREVFFPLNTPEGSEPTALETRDALLRDFRERHGAEVATPAEDNLNLPGTSVAGASAAPVVALVRQAWETTHRYPLAVAHECGRILSSEGLHLFKAHENVTYVGVSRPHALDRQAFPVSESISLILTHVEEHPGLGRAELRQAIEASEAPDTSAAAPPRPSSFSADLAWLLHQGHLVDFGNRGIESAALTQKNARPPKPRKKNKPAKKQPRASAETPAQASEPSSGASPESSSESPKPAAENAEAATPEAAGDIPAVESSNEPAPEPTSERTPEPVPETTPNEILPPAEEQSAPTQESESPSAPDEYPPTQAGLPPEEPRSV